MKIRFIGHASFIITDDVIIAVDPFRVKTGEKVDYIFITHPHVDHYTPGDIRKLSRRDTTIIFGPAGCDRKNIRDLCKEFVHVVPGKEYTKGIRFRTIPAYNFTLPFHPAKKKWVGYILYLSRSLYFAGDTDKIPEMEGLKPDIFFVPVGGIFTMNAEKAAEAVKSVSPQKVIPIHGSKRNAKKLAALSPVPVEILEPGQEISL
jgi:L-ascorbate metabolism protein UlaG (beta-lactamase superfamily)